MAHGPPGPPEGWAKPVLWMESSPGGGARLRHSLFVEGAAAAGGGAVPAEGVGEVEIGRASCRERV